MVAFAATVSSCFAGSPRVTTTAVMLEDNYFGITEVYSVECCLLVIIVIIIAAIVTIADDVTADVDTTDVAAIVDAEKAIITFDCLLTQEQ